MGTRPRNDLASVTAAIGQPARAAMLDALMGGEWLTATELARRAGISPATASGHIEQLVNAGLVTRRRSGRHRYHALAGPTVAAALEALGRISAPRAEQHGPEEDPLRFARTCYDHLAGSVGVALADALVRLGYVAASGAELTAAGERWLGQMAIDLDALRASRRRYVRFCLDWSERRDHLAGAVGAAVTAALLERRWILRLDGTRAVRLTQRGREGLRRSLDLEI